MYPVQYIEHPEQKSRIAEKILRSIPDWFGIEEAIVEYVAGVRPGPFFAAYHGEEPVGFISIKYNNPYTAEIYVIGLREDYHRKGIGTALLQKAEQLLRERHYRFLMVKTLDETAKSEHYDRSRAYYVSMGFYPLEVLPELWDKSNPCLLMIKNI